MKDNKNLNIFEKLKAKEKMPRLIMLVVFSCLLMILGQTNALKVVKQSFVDTTAFITYSIGSAIGSVGEIAIHAKDLWSIQSKYKSLKNENYKLRAAKQDLDKYKRQNAELKSLLNYSIGHSSRSFATKILATGHGMFNGGLILFLGSTNAIRPGYIVNTSQGLVGKVSAVGLFTSRVTPITDWGSNVPVLIGAEQIPAIVSGANNNMLQVTNVRPDFNKNAKSSNPKLNSYDNPYNHIQVGDGIITSGIGGAYPANMKIGFVSSITKNNYIIITPYAQIKGERRVLVSDYDLKTLTDDIFSK